MCISWNSWWRCSIARTSKICLDWHQKSDFELNSNIHLRHSCNQNMQNVVTWGQNMSANIEEFACISYSSSGSTTLNPSTFGGMLDSRDFAFFCVWTNETSSSSQFAQLFSLAKTLQRKQHLAPALMHFGTKSWSKMVVSWRYADLSMEWSRPFCVTKRVGHVHYVAIDDLVITTLLQKRYNRPLGHALVEPVHLC